MAQSQSGNLATVATLPTAPPLPPWEEPKNEQDALEKILSLGTSFHEHAYTVGNLLRWVRFDSPTFKGIAPKGRSAAFERWVKANFWFSVRTARRMMTYAKRCDSQKATRKLLLPYHVKGSGSGQAVSQQEKDYREAVEKADQTLKEAKRECDRVIAKAKNDPKVTPQEIGSAREAVTTAQTEVDNLKGQAPIVQLQTALFRLEQKFEKMTSWRRKAALKAIADAVEKLNSVPQADEAAL